MKLNLSTFKVSKCGYYDAAENLVCFPLRECLDALVEWLRPGTATVRDTCTSGDDSGGECLPVYLYAAVRHDADNFLLTTWNEVEHSAEAVATLDPSGVAGATVADSVEVPNGHIPGYPTHFWFIPSESRVILVQLDGQRLNGHQGLNLYLNGYLSHTGPHVIRGASAQGDSRILERVVGFSVRPRMADGVQVGLTAAYRSVPCYRKGDVEVIKANVASITHLLRKSRPITGGTVPREFIDSFLAFFNLNTPDRSLPNRVFSFSVPCKPTPEELETLISTHVQTSHQAWDDVGFKFSGGLPTKWLNQARVKRTIELDTGSILASESTAIDPARLLSQLVLRRSEVLGTNRRPLA